MTEDQMKAAYWQDRFKSQERLCLHLKEKADALKAERDLWRELAMRYDGLVDPEFLYPEDVAHIRSLKERIGKL